VLRKSISILADPAVRLLELSNIIAFETNFDSRSSTVRLAAVDDGFYHERTISALRAAGIEAVVVSAKEAPPAPTSDNNWRRALLEFVDYSSELSGYGDDLTITRISRDSINLYLNVRTKNGEVAIAFTWEYLDSADILPVEIASRLHDQLGSE